MSTHHSITIETLGLITRTVEKKDEKNFDPLSDWPEIIEDPYEDYSITVLEKPAYIHEIVEEKNSWEVTVKVPISISRSVVTDDYEHKAWRSIDWDDPLQNKELFVSPLCDEKFEVIDDQRYKVDDDEEETEEEGQ